MVLRFFFILVRMVIIEKISYKCWKEVEGSRVFKCVGESICYCSFLDVFQIKIIIIILFYYIVLGYIFEENEVSIQLYYYGYCDGDIVC